MKNRIILVVGAVLLGIIVVAHAQAQSSPEMQ